MFGSRFIDFIIKSNLQYSNIGHLCSTGVFFLRKVRLTPLNLRASLKTPPQLQNQKCSVPHLFKPGTKTPQTKLEQLRVVFDPVAVHVYCAPLCMSGSLIPKSGHLRFVAQGERRRNSSLQQHPRPPRDRFRPLPLVFPSPTGYPASSSARRRLCSP